MTVSWQHRKMARIEPTNDPIQGEFFNTDGVRNQSGALIREAAQNSQDAAAGTGPVKLRLTLRNLDATAQSSEMRPFFAGIWPHLTAPRNGLKNAPAPDDPLRILIVEDTGTWGLRGDVAAEEVEPGGRNDFCYFFRVFGRSGKSEKEKGSWGIGRNVFPASSRANCFFALTRRKDDGKSLLMGLSVLKTHDVDSARRAPYGYFSRRDGDGFALPAEDPQIIKGFCSAFGLIMPTAGLTVVIPWATKEIKAPDLIEAAVREYFLPILHGTLIVEVVDETSSVLINASTLESVAAQTPPVTRQEILPLIRLARWASVHGEASRDTFLSCEPGRVPQWDQSLAPADRISAMRDVWGREKPLSIRVPVRVALKGQPAEHSHFDVAMERTQEEETAKAIFVREGLIVTKAVERAPRGVRAIVTIQSGPLASLLRDAEEPSHTEWKERGEKFKDKYEHGPSWLRFVKQSVDRLAAILAGDQDAEDDRAFLDLFSLDIPAENDTNRRRRKKKKAEQTELPENHEIKSNKAGLAINKLQGGFSITKGPRPSGPPRQFVLTVAYGVRRKDAFDNYEPADFELGTSRTPWEVQGCQVEKLSGNQLLVTVKDPDFRLSVKGFDENRDVMTDTVSVEINND